MRQNPNYTLEYLDQKPYLLPFGQMIADQNKGFSINETGKAIWDLLQNPMSMEQLLEQLWEQCALDLEYKKKFEEEIGVFVEQLMQFKVILDDEEEGTSKQRKETKGACEKRSMKLHLEQEEAAGWLEIAGLRIALFGKKEAISLSFGSFFKESPSKELLGKAFDQSIFLVEQGEFLCDGKGLLHNPNQFVYEKEDCFQLRFPAFEQLQVVELQKDGRKAVFYLRPPYEETLKEEIFQGVRTAFLYLAAQHGMYALHSASILYKDKAWLFSGASGTGKSTYASLWHQYENVSYINGDLNLLSIVDGKPVIYGIPWCGTSKIYDEKTYPLGGIVLLKQAKVNALFPLQEDKKQLLILQRLISPRWNKELFTKMVPFVQNLSPKIQVWKLGFTVSKEAVECLQNEI